MGGSSQNLFFAQANLNFGLLRLRQLRVSSLRGCLSPCLPKSSLANNRCSLQSGHFGSISCRQRQVMVLVTHREEERKQNWGVKGMDRIFVTQQGHSEIVSSASYI